MALVSVVVNFAKETWGRVFACTWWDFVGRDIKMGYHSAISYQFNFAKLFYCEAWVLPYWSQRNLAQCKSSIFYTLDWFLVAQQLLSKHFWLLDACCLLFDSVILSSFYGAILPRRRPHHVSMLSVRPSVCLSVCPVLPSTGKTKRPTNTKLGRKGPRDTSTPWTNFEVKGSKVKATGHSSCVNVSLIIRIFVYCLHRVVDKTIGYFVLLRY